MSPHRRQQIGELVRIAAMPNARSVTKDYHRGVEDDPFPGPVELPIEDVLDLHSVPPKDVKVIVEEYLFQARQAGFKALRIIHGRGIGVQREIVRGVLAETTFVADYCDAPAEAGGWGATVVTLL